MPLPADIIGLDHVQVAAPKGCERKARQFYGDILGMAEIPKPKALKRRGGCWFRCGTAQLHVGVQPDFAPATKAHPALAVGSVHALADRLRKKGVTVSDIEDLEGRPRFFADDPFGNRLEFTEPAGRDAYEFGT
jgi:catechol 2,3-dioxygenase-like lactoylglutathione lyase family enzyme